MSPRFWWRPGSRPDLASDPAPTGPDAWWTALPCAAAVSTLLRLSGRHESGALEFAGGPGGAVYLLEGLVSQVVSPHAPGVAERMLRHLEPGGHHSGERGDARVRAEQAIREGRLGQGELAALLSDAAADAGLDTLAGAESGGPLPRFTPGRRHWAPLPRALPAGALLDEIGRRRRVLAAIAARSRPDEPVSRAGRLPVDRIRLTSRQWELVRTANGRRTPRAMARGLGTGVFATTVDVAALVQAGVLGPVSDEPPGLAGPPSAAMPFLHAASGS